MDVLTRNNLNLLMAVHKGPCVSVFMPMHRSGPETQQDPIRLKNLIREAEERLVTRGIPATEARELLESAQKLLQGDLFHQHQSDGFGMFLSPEVFRTYLLPFVFKELVIVTDRFHIRPLLPLLSGDEDLLEFAAIQTLLNRGTVYVVEPEKMPDIESLAAVLRY